MQQRRPSGVRRRVGEDMEQFSHVVRPELSREKASNLVQRDPEIPEIMAISLSSCYSLGRRNVRGI